MQFVERITTDIAECHPLEPAPYALIRIEVRRIAGQAQQFQSLGSTGGKELLDRLAAMD